MIKLNVGDKWEVNIKNETKELNLDNINDLINIESQELTYFQKINKTFKTLSDSDKYLYIDDESLLDVYSEIRKFGDFEDNNKKKFKESLFIDGTKYILRLKDGYPIINLKVMELVEKYIKEKPKDWVKYSVALLYQEEDSDLEYHFRDKNVKKRLKIFENSEKLTGDFIFPLVFYVSKRVTNSIFKFKDILENTNSNTNSNSNNNDNEKK